MRRSCTAVVSAIAKMSTNGMIAIHPGAMRCHGTASAASVASTTRPRPATNIGSAKVCGRRRATATATPTMLPVKISCQRRTDEVRCMAFPLASAR